MIEILTSLLNKVVLLGKIPKIWKKSVTSMLYKGKGPKYDPLNYRPIALISCVYKIYSAILTKRLIILFSSVQVTPLVS